MPLIADAGPLISLARIQQLELLPQAFSQLSVPPAVYREVTRDSQLPGARELADTSWLRVVEVDDTKAVDRLGFWLDQGESEAIVLARAQQLPLAIDERRGRRIAASLGVETTGTVGILIASKRLGLVPAVTPLLDELIANGIRISPSLYRSACSMAQEL